MANVHSSERDQRTRTISPTKNPSPLSFGVRHKARPASVDIHGCSSTPQSRAIVRFPPVKPVAFLATLIQSMILALSFQNDLQMDQRSLFQRTPRYRGEIGLITREFQQLQNVVHRSAPGPQGRVWLYIINIFYTLSCIVWWGVLHNLS